MTTRPDLAAALAAHYDTDTPHHDDPADLLGTKATADLAAELEASPEGTRATYSASRDGRARLATAERFTAYRNNREKD